VHDALAWARRLRTELGALPVVGETLPEFRYLQLWVGDDDCGATLELLEPAGPGFALTALRPGSGRLRCGRAWIDRHRRDSRQGGGATRCSIAPNTLIPSPPLISMRIVSP
jgi:hypothetical protein